MIASQFQPFARTAPDTPQRYDELTGLPNRESLATELVSLLGVPRLPDRIGALLLIDIDSFHLTNEVFGHRAGDALLRRVASGLRRWADGRFTLARTGGDEFAVALTAAAGVDLRAWARSARAVIAAECKPQVPALSIGIATFDPRRPPSLEALLKCASTALHDAKRDGGGLIATYRVGERYGAGGAEWVVRALQEHRLTLFSQPIFDLRSGQVARRELLVRALDEDGHLVMPSSFIPVAERYQLMPAVDRWVVARALELAAAGARLSINVSAQSLTDVTPLATMVKSAIRAGVDPKDLMFEVTETAAIADSGAGYHGLRSLAELGCPLALDDFGAGFGCFSYLKHVPTQVVKIDREFIRDIATDTTDLAITTAIANLTRELGIDAVAEGVEDQAALSVVASTGVRYAQGYLLGEPAPVRCTANAISA
jgi:diguanylate cyclase (GGDEF)-like protein